ncbi:hypothetical protein FBU30_001903 [Linnemannia zychae]|nr:hypothetical protein FBU30_001903 [Linnemannia zychae]
MAAGSDSVTHVWYDPRFKSRKALKEEDAKRQLQGSRPISSLDRGPLVQYALQSVNNPPKGILIRDVKPVVISGMDEYIVTLSDKELGMYRWTESQPDIGDDDEDDDEEDSSHTEKEDEADDPVLARKKGKRRRVESENSEIIFLGENIGGSGGGRGGESSIHPGSSRSSSPFFCTQ